MKWLKKFITPPLNKNARRFPDDWQPRANIKKGFSNGSLQTETDIDRFATKFAVDPKLVEEYVQHLNDLKQRSQMRAAQRGRKSQQLRQKTFKEYEWRQLVLGGEISKLKVFELDKYLDKHNLLTGKKALKDNKAKCIISLVLRNDSSATHTNAVACASYNQRECVDESDKDDDDHDGDGDGDGGDDGDGDDMSDSEEDLILNDLDESAESGDSETEESEDQPELFDRVILRSERLATTWQSRFLVQN